MGDENELSELDRLLQLEKYTTSINKPPVFKSATAGAIITNINNVIQQMQSQGLIVPVPATQCETNTVEHNKNADMLAAHTKAYTKIVDALQALGFTTGTDDPDHVVELVTALITDTPTYKLFDIPKIVQQAHDAVTAGYPVFRISKLNALIAYLNTHVIFVPTTSPQTYLFNIIMDDKVIYTYTRQHQSIG